MGLIGTPEVAALSFDFKHNKVHGIRLLKHARHGIEVVKSSCNEDSDIMVAANRVLKDLSVNSAVYLILSVPLNACEVFDCELPAAAPDLMRDALRFEVPRQLMSVPENFQLQYVTLNSREDGTSQLRCAVFPEESLRDFSKHLVTLRSKPDAVINPLLTLPADLPADAPVCCPGMEEGFCWQNRSWQILTDELRAQCNLQWMELLRKYCAGSAAAELADEFAPALSAALLGIRKLFTDNAALAGVVVLPDALRPARFRTQLRVTALLLVLLALVNICHYGGGYMSKYSELRKLSAQVRNTKNKVQDLRKKVRTAEKQLKDMQRTAGLNIGSRECLPYLAYLSEKLPAELGVSNFRWNEDSVDLNVQTTAPDLDLVSFFNRLPGTKILNATQRTNPGNGLTSGNIKLAWETDKLQIILPPDEIAAEFEAAGTAAAGSAAAAEVKK